MGHYLTDTESKALSEELGRVRNDRNDMFVELTRLRAQQTALVEALIKLRNEIKHQHTAKNKGSRNHLGDIVHQRDADRIDELAGMVDLADEALATLDVPDPKEQL